MDTSLGSMMNVLNYTTGISTVFGNSITTVAIEVDSNYQKLKNKYKLLQKKLRSSYMMQEGNVIGPLRKNNPQRILYEI